MMRIEERIDSWVKRGFITEAQAVKLRADAPLASGQDAERALASSGVGAVLLVLSALLNGAVLLGFSYASGIHGGMQGALGLWALSLAPLVYVLRHVSLAGVLGSLVYLWVWLLVFGDSSVADLSSRALHVPVLYLAAGVTVFALGGAHYLVPSLASVARGIRLAGLYVTLAMLFALSFRAVSENAGGVMSVQALDTAGRFSWALGTLAGLGGALTLFNMWLRRRVSRITRPEGPISLAILAFALMYFFMPLPGLVYMVLFNAVLLAMIATLLTVGFRWQDARVLDMGGVALMLVLLSRYYDLAWGLLGIAGFIGGAVALAVSVWLALTVAKRQALQIARARERAQLVPPPV